MVNKKNEAIQGLITEALPNATFRVRLDNGGNEIIAHISGKMRIYRIRVLVGDKVLVEVDSYGMRGRIIKRL